MDSPPHQPHFILPEDPDSADIEIETAAPYVLTRKDVKNLRLMVRYWEQMTDYLHQRTRPIRFIWLNLISGMAKGLGTALGITVIAFIAFKLLVGLQVLNLPFIGNFIAELIEYINNVQGLM